MARASKDKLRRERVRAERDFINAPEYNDSMKVMVAKNPDNDGKGYANATICRILMISRAELDSISEAAMVKLRRGMQADE